MKKIEAVFQLSKLNEVQTALENIGIDEMTVCEVRGFGRQNRHKEIYRTREHMINSLPMIRMDLVVEDQNLGQAVSVVMKSAKTDAQGDAKILISDVNEAAYALTI